MTMKDLEHGRDPKAAKTGNGIGPGRKFNAFKELARGTDFTKINNPKEKKDADAWKPKTVEFNGKALELDGEGKLKDVTQVEYQAGTVVKFTGAGDVQSSWHTLRDTLQKDFPDVFVNVRRDSTEGHVTFKDSESVPKFLEKMKEDKVELGGKVLEWHGMSGQFPRQAQQSSCG